MKKIVSKLQAWGRNLLGLENFDDVMKGLERRVKRNVRESLTNHFVGDLERRMEFRVANYETKSLGIWKEVLEDLVRGQIEEECRKTETIEAIVKRIQGVQLDAS